LNTLPLITLRSSTLFTLLLALLIIVPASPAFSGNSSLSTASSFLEDTNADKFLPPEQAFKLSISATDRQTLHADFKVAPGHYLYRDRIKFSLQEPANGRIADINLPAGEVKQDPYFGETEVYHHDLTAVLTLAGVTQDKVTVATSYQGCSEKGLCYAPINKVFTVDLTDFAGTTTSEADTGFADEQAASLLKNGKLWLIAMGFFGFGLLLSFTPCVLPMIPILSGIIVGSKQRSRWHSFNLSLAYTLGMALSYTLIGVAAGLSGQLLSAALQNAWALGAAAIVFVLLALSMFGFYELRLPTRWEERMVSTSNRFKGGRFFGVFIMGALSALIVSPCVAAPLAGALLYISQTHDVVLGGTALFALAMGMGLPLLLIGASAGTLLPRVGPWMDAVRNFFGVIMLGMAIWLVSPILPVSLVLGLWGALLIVPAIYLHALDSLPATAGAWRKFWKGVGVILLICGIALLLGALSGSKSPLQPLAGLRGDSAEQASASLPFTRVRNVQELDEQIDAAAGKTVMLDFYADWCVACKEYERFTFSDKRVQQRLQDTVLLQADVTQNSADDQALLQRFGLFGPPGIIFFDANGQQIPNKIIGYQNAAQFLATLNRLGL
jgi:thiol:disulfide interchange protein DsbD